MHSDALSEIVDGLDTFARMPGGLDALRALISDLAVVGELVPQIATEDSGHELLQKVLLRTSGTKPSRKLSSKDPALVSLSLPESWATSYLGNLAVDISYGTSMKASDTGDLPILRMGNIQRQKIDYSTLKFLPQLSDADGLLLRENDLLFNRTNSRELVGKSAVYHGDADAYTFASYLIRVRFDPDVSAEFVNIWLGSTYGRSWARRVRTDAIGQSNINGTSLGAFALGFPGRAEQDRIVDRFNLATAKLDAIEQRLAEEETARRSLSRVAFGNFGLSKDTFALDHLDDLVKTSDDVKELEASILTRAMRGELVEQVPSEGTGRGLLEELAAARELRTISTLDGDDLPFDLPDSWVWVRLGDLAELQMGRTPRRGDTRWWGSSTVPFVSIADLVDQQVITHTKEGVSAAAISEVYRDRLAHKGALLYSFKLTIGKMSILGMDAVHNEAIMSISPYHEETREYLFRILKVVDPMRRTKSAVKGSTLNSKSLAALEIPLPPLDEQRRIVSRIDEFRKCLATLRDRLSL
ncbi:type I restriction enzyme S subunit [Mycobacterium frederiksbergense]|uniref:Type I restriction enzyme S subunit n=1 Tax=Mycolicibacterium frederiksbergense TaxID=117567 RepID=A0ABT6LA31_9MYCO|nr:restriction endonuclease subunit S [Mycolicibacterium frederiksbergense]MDH6199082.1 type I restriction enzyme S subunit [Mycolicibacterium frederiksbergense]